MDDKTFELLEKMYADITKRLDVIETGQIEIKTDMNEFRKETNSRLSKLEVKFEHDITNSLQSLHEGVAGNTSQLKEHTEQLNTIGNKVDYIALNVTSQDNRLKVVEASKKKAK